MLNGLKETVRVGFLFQQSAEWLGGLNYFKNLFIAMATVSNPKIIPYILPPDNEYSKILLDYAKTTKIRAVKGFKYRLAKLISFITHSKFDKNKYIKQVCDDIDLTSHYQTLDDKPAILWISDFQHIHLPEMFSKNEIRLRNEYFKSSAERANAIVVSSNDALNDFRNFLPELAHKGVVLNFVAIPDKSIYTQTDEIKAKVIEKFNLPTKFFYMPNQFWKHKNHIIVFEAISILKQAGIEIQLVCSGNTKDYRNPGYFAELTDLIKNKNIGNNVKILGLIDLIEVHCLMRNCISLINPSLFEGWSSTVEEAKSIGKNIILSNLNVHKEQNPANAVYFDPNDAEELSNILKNNWNSMPPGPDYDLEETAKAMLEQRIADFGKQYQNIVCECLRQDTRK